MPISYFSQITVLSAHARAGRFLCSGPFSEKRLNFVRGAGGAALGEAVPATAPAMEGLVHVPNQGTQVLPRVDHGPAIAAVAAGENGTPAAAGAADGVAQPPDAVRLLSLIHI